MNGSLRQSMAWLHTWSGLIVGWVLFSIFVTGTASYYRSEISRWMRPELTHTAPLDAPALGAAAERALAYLAVHAPKARTWFIGLPQPDKPVIDLFWRTAPGEPPGHVLLDPRTGTEATVRDTHGGDFLYRFHFELHMPPLWGRWVVGICAMTMLTALISGVITHRRIFADFFTFRPGKALRRSLLDAHNVAGVLALPFHLMITYTGFVTIATLYMPWGVTAAYQGDTQAYFAQAGWITVPRPPAKRSAPLTAVAPLVERAVATVPQTLQRLTIVNQGDAHATVLATFVGAHGLSRDQPQIAFDGVDGRLLEIVSGDLRPAARTLTTMVGLHEARFAGAALRVLFFLCGVMGCAMVATGLVLWSVARAPRHGAARPFGKRLVDTMNVATVAGLPAAIAAYFLANRLLPVALAERASWEVRAFFAAWLAIAFIAALRSGKRAWPEMLSLAAMLYVLVALIDAARATWERAAAGENGLMFLGFDLALLTIAACLFVAARKIVRYKDVERRRVMEPEEA